MFFIKYISLFAIKFITNLDQQKYILHAIIEKINKSDYSLSL